MTTSRRSFDRSMAMLARARRSVPGASQTLSKGADMFVEGAYPAFLERGRGCRVWDVDGGEYIDYLLGLASITLGYAYPAVTEAVARQLGEGSIFSLPHPLEVEVAERLIEVIPCAEWARFLKTGTEANSAAIRVARAHTGREVILYCGYHGWADFYAITTPRSKGVPKDFARFIVPFDYNNLSSLERAFDEHYGSVAAVIMEGVLIDAPAAGFLEVDEAGGEHVRVGRRGSFMNHRQGVFHSGSAFDLTLGPKVGRRAPSLRMQGPTRGWDAGPGTDVRRGP